MTVRINKPAINLREELASLRNQGGLSKEVKLYLEGIVDNGDFSNGITGWVKTGGTGSIAYNASFGAITVTPNTEVWITGSHSLKPSTTYKVSYNLKQAGTGVSGVRVYLGDNTYSQVAKSASTGVRTYLITTEDSPSLLLNVEGTGDWVVDDIRIYEIGKNLVTNGTFDYDSGWTKGTGWTISGGTASCDGSQTGNTGLSTSDYSQYTSGKVFNITYTISNYVAGQVNFHIRGNGAGNVSGNGTYNQTVTAGTATGYGINLFADSAFNADIDNITVTEGNHHVIQSIPYGYDVKDVYIDGELAREGEAYDYQVKTDGINQWLKPTVEPTATTETVVIGVRK